MVPTSLFCSMQYLLKFHRAPADVDSTERNEHSVSKIVPLNIENFHTNRTYLKELMNSADIICVQEHWLYNFEQQTLDKFCEGNNFEVYMKSVDDSDPISPLQRPRGKGGVATMWLSNISRNVTKLPDGSERVCAVRCDTEEGPVSIVNVYMPCRGYSSSEQMFNEILDEVREIVIKYSIDSRVILLGDMNASLHRGQSMSRDKKFALLLAELNMVLSDSYPADHTYVHGTGRSTIDYIVGSDREVVRNVNIHVDSSLNTSPHSALMADLPYIPQHEILKSDPKGCVTSINWNKLDHQKYESLIAERLSVPSTEECLDIESRIGKITDIVSSTALECAPQRKQKPKNCRKFWCPNLTRLSKESKKAFGDWKKGGRPADPHCDLVLAKNIAKRELRRKQRQCAAENRSKKYREITMAHTSDKALFHKLIDRQRQVGRAKLCELVIDDIHVSGSEKNQTGMGGLF